jgi:hypothetical protein
VAGDLVAEGAADDVGGLLIERDIVEHRKFHRNLAD